MKKQSKKKKIAQFETVKIQKEHLHKIKGGEEADPIVIEEEIIN